MSHPQLLRYSRLLVGLLGFSALVTEIATLRERGHFVPANFFSYFTIESNILAILILLVYGTMAKVPNKRTPLMQLIRGGIVLYMVMTGLIFTLLLAGIAGATLTAVPWDNVVLHYIMPLAILADWGVDRPKMPISLKRAWVWLVFPIGYVTYTLVRGAIVHWYPYPFLDPRTHGYTPVLLTSTLLAVGVVTASWVVCRTTRSKRQGARRRP